jgi:hypothetical protein
VNPAKMRQAFVIGSYLLVAVVVVQFLLAGLGVFTTFGFFWHATVNGAIVLLLPILMLIAGRLGKVPTRLMWMALLIPVLVIVQSLLLFPYHLHATGALRAVSSLHVVNALAIFAVALRLMDGSRELGKA